MNSNGTKSTLHGAPVDNYVRCLLERKVLPRGLPSTDVDGIARHVNTSHIEGRIGDDQHLEALLILAISSRIVENECSHMPPLPLLTVEDLVGECTDNLIKVFTPGRARYHSTLGINKSFSGFVRKTTRQKLTWLKIGGYRNGAGPLLSYEEETEGDTPQDPNLYVGDFADDTQFEKQLSGDPSRYTFVEVADAINFDKVRGAQARYKAVVLLAAQCDLTIPRRLPHRYRNQVRDLAAHTPNLVVASVRAALGVERIITVPEPMIAVWDGLDEHTLERLSRDPNIAHCFFQYAVGPLPRLKASRIARLKYPIKQLSCETGWSTFVDRLIDVFLRTECERVTPQTVEGDHADATLLRALLLEATSFDGSPLGNTPTRVHARLQAHSVTYMRTEFEHELSVKVPSEADRLSDVLVAVLRKKKS